MRAQYRGVVRNSSGDVVPSASVEVRQPNTTNKIADTIYADDTGSGTLGNPFTADVNGVVQFYLERSQRVDLYGSAFGTIEDVEVMTVAQLSRSATLIVASDDASPEWKAAADYICDGTDDDVEIRAAVDALPNYGYAEGGTIILSDGYFFPGANGLDLSQPTRKDMYKIKGQGRFRATQFYGTVSTAPVINVGTGVTSSQTHIELEDFAVVTVTKPTPDVDTRIAIKLAGCDNVIMNRIRIDRAYTGIQIKACQWVSARDLQVQGCRKFCLDLVCEAYGIDGHYLFEICNFWVPITCETNAAAVHLIRGTNGTPIFSIAFVVCQLCNTSDVAGTRLFWQEGTFGSIHRAASDLNFMGCCFEDLATVGGGIGCDFETSCGVNFLGCDWPGNTTMQYAIRTATGEPGHYNLLNCSFNNVNYGTGYNIYNRSGDFFICGYHSSVEDNHYYDATTVHQVEQSLAKSGAIGDGDLGDGVLAMDGMVGLDKTAHRLMVRDNAAWKYTGFVNEQGGAASVSDGGTIAHGMGATPTGVVVIGSVAGEIVSVTAKTSTTFTVAIKKHDGTAGTTQTVYWRAW